KTALPLDLSPLYELPEHVSVLDPPFLARLIAAALLTGVLCLLRNRWPAGLALWSAYAVMLAPVSGLAQAGHQLGADRYTYLSCLPWALLVGAAVCATRDAVASGRLRPPFAVLTTGIVAVWLAGLATLTWLQVQVWRDSETLWRYALEMNPACVLCRNNFGAGLANRGNPGAAILHFEQALSLRPDDAGLRANLGLALLKTGRASEAIPHLARTLELNPAAVDTRVSLGVALILVGRMDEATVQLRQAVRASPANARARYELSRAYRLQGDHTAAEEQADALRRLDPRLAQEVK
ncbi:MAG TPA: tetratricopeptide repeat protein, partial [Anaeromyxobacteraceae bacterium]|nr:tetratricopeptide repeat protein [Anaeromyxobacteraceae bacterium]